MSLNPLSSYQPLPEMVTRPVGCRSPDLTGNSCGNCLLHRCLYQPLDALQEWLANEPLPAAFKRGASMQPRLNLTAVKRQHDRFNADFEVSAFDSGSIFDRGSERSREVRADELADERAQARYEGLHGSDE